MEVSRLRERNLLPWPLRAHEPTTPVARLREKRVSLGTQPPSIQGRREWTLSSLGEALAEIGSAATSLWLEIAVIAAVAVSAVLGKLVLSGLREVKAQRRYEARVAQLHEAKRERRTAENAEARDEIRSSKIDQIARERDRREA